MTRKSNTKSPTPAGAVKATKAKATSAPGKRKTAATTPKSRAVIRDVEAGSSVDCEFCGDRVKFQAKVRNKQVICNVYTKGVWDRVDHFHLDCYSEAKSPHGPAEAGTDHRRAAANAAAAERAKKFAKEAAAQAKTA